MSHLPSPLQNHLQYSCRSFSFIWKIYFQITKYKTTTFKNNCLGLAMKCVSAKQENQFECCSVHLNTGNKVSSLFQMWSRRLFTQSDLIHHNTCYDTRLFNQCKHERKDLFYLHLRWRGFFYLWLGLPQPGLIIAGCLFSSLKTTPKPEDRCFPFIADERLFTCDMWPAPS